MCIHALLINIPYAIIGSSLEFAMPGRDTMVPSEKTIENFCGNYITNTVTQDSMINAVYVVGRIPALASCSPVLGPLCP